MIRILSTLGRSAAVLAVPAMAFAAAVPAHAAGASASHASIEVCGQGPDSVKPGSMILACADDGELADQLQWSSWTSTGATATGRVTWRGHGGTWNSAAASVTLAGPVSVPGHGTLFTRLELHVTGPTPKGFMRDLTYNEAPSSVRRSQAERATGSTTTTRASVRPNAASGQLGYAEVEGYWIAAGGRSSTAETAAAIAGAESSYYPGIIQQGVDYCGAGADRAGWGLWQITCGDSVPAFGTNFQLLDPWNNAEAGVAKYNADVAAGVDGFDPWSTYTSGAYQSYLQNVAPDLGVTDPGEYVQDGATPAGTPSSPAPAPGSTYGPPMPGSGPAEAFQANTGFLYTVTPSGTTNTQLGMLPGTSPAIASTSTGYVEAFQANTGYLYLTSATSTWNTQEGMMAGTSPAITALPGGGWEVAFQDNHGFLYTMDASGNLTDSTEGMKAGTSPSIAANGSGYQVAFQSNTGFLYNWSPGGGADDTQLGMMAGTSPSIAELSSGKFVEAFQDNNGFLWTQSSDGPVDSEEGMMGGTSPAIAASGGGYQVAFHANTGFLFTWSPGGGPNDTQLGMLAGTSPGIVALASGGFEEAFQDDHGFLWTDSSNGPVNSELGMMSATSPAIA
ncbi:MAG TPA: hypothetical protein VFN97_27165 [Actinospica sp.]|nr:hypothetical protein [Actinospica sp.]